MRRVKFPKELSLTPFLGPRYWPMWALLGLMHGAAKLPPRWQLKVGRVFGRLLRRVKARQRRVARRNIELCFPRLSAAEKRGLLERHFDAVGMSFVEMGVGWFTPIERLLRIANVRVKTAGGGAGKKADLQGGHGGALRGIEDAEKLRDEILALLKAYRDAGLGDREDRPKAAPGAVSAALLERLRDVRDEVVALRAALDRR